MENLSIGKLTSLNLLTSTFKFTTRMQFTHDLMQFSAEIYTSDKRGNDETGDGSEGKPYKTVLQAMRHAGKEPFPTIYVDAKEEGKVYELAAKSQLKKIQKIWVRENHKAADRAKAQEETDDKRQQNIEEAKKIVIKEDTTLPKAKIIKICEGKYHNIVYDCTNLPN